MSCVPANDEAINIDSSFTDLFALLKKRRLSNQINGYTNADLNKTLIQIDNASVGVLHGLQSIGRFIASSSDLDNEDVLQMGYFLSLLGNLLEALHLLRADFDYNLVIND